MKTKDIEKLQKELFIKYNLNDWEFKFDNSKKRFGICSYRKKIISLSKELCVLNDKEIVTDTLLHEIAHAIVGHGNGHNKIWQRKAIEIGCNGQRCYDENVTMPKKKWKGICPGCNKIIYRYRKILTLACGRCCGKNWSIDYQFIWENNK